MANGLERSSGDLTVQNCTPVIVVVRIWKREKKVLYLNGKFNGGWWSVCVQSFPWTGWLERPPLNNK